jgi:hypothetical protein
MTAAQKIARLAYIENQLNLLGEQLLRAKNKIDGGGEPIPLYDQVLAQLEALKSLESRLGKI